MPETYAIDCRNAALCKELCPTLQAHASGGTSLNCTHPVLYFVENHGKDARYTILGDGQTCQTLARYMGTGGNNTPFVLECTNE